METGDFTIFLMVEEELS